MLPPNDNDLVRSIKRLAIADNANTLANREVTAADHGADVLYRIAKADGVGRYIVASRDIRPGEVIFTDQAACVGPFIHTVFRSFTRTSVHLWYELQARTTVLSRCVLGAT